MKIVFGVATMMLVVGVAYIYLHPRQAIIKNAPVTQSALFTQGTVTNVDAAKLEITIDTSSGVKTVHISPTTKIEKIVVQKSASGAVEKQIAVEVNITEMQKGDIVNVRYLSETGTALSQVVLVTSTVNENIDKFLVQRARSLQASPSIYLRGQVVLIDLANKKLEYRPYIIATLATTTASIAFSSDIPVYRVDAASSVSIVHARIPAALSDIKTGGTIFLMADYKLLQTGKIVLQAFIILKI